MLGANSDATNSTCIGTGALLNNTTSGSDRGDNNTAISLNALNANTTGDRNAASGAFVLRDNITGSENVAIGFKSMDENISGAENSAVGAFALSSSNGSNNIALGHFAAGSAWTTGSAGQLGTSKSSIRYKEDVHTMGDASSPVMNLRPVTFRYKEAEADGSKPIQYGLIAEEVEKVMPDLVIYNEQGTPESVAYELLPSLLLNEYQKQGRALAAAEAKLVATEAELGETQAKLEAMDAELAALKLAVSRLAAAPAAVKLAGSQP